MLISGNAPLLTHAKASDTTDDVNNFQQLSHVKNQEKNLIILEDNLQQKVTSVTDGGITTKSTYDKVNEKLIVEVENEKPIVIDMNEATKIAKEQYSQDSNTTTYARANTVKENTYSNYEYTITFGKKESWQVRIPKGNSKTRTRTNSNKSTLNNFKTQVDIINDAELRMLGLLGSTAFFGVLAVILAMPTAGSGTLTSAMSAAGAYGGALSQGVTMQRAQKNAIIYYNRL